MKIEMWKVEDVKPYEQNPRINDAAVESVAKSIKEFGFRQPIVVDGDGVIIVGHTRLKAAKVLGLEKVPVHVAKDLSPAQIKAYRIADNKLAELAEWNMDLLPVELKDLVGMDFDIEMLGFASEELERMLGPEFAGTAGLTDPDAIPDPPKDPITKTGDLWILGNHRLLCGDSTKPEDVRRVMAGEKAVLFATDPPYLVDYDGNNHPHKWGARDNNKDWSDTYGMTWDDAEANPELYDKFIAVAKQEAILENAAWYCWHAFRRQAMVEGVWQKHGAFAHQQIIWNKDRPVITRSWYMWQHEPCFFGWVRPHKPPRIADDNPHSVWNIPTIPPGTKTEHPTSKPVQVFEIPMRQHAKPGELCYEPFSGSGSQLIAAEKTGRRCYAIEISPVYCDVAVRRWEEFTGKKAERVCLEGPVNQSPAYATH
jgi:DNA modification methylase